MHSKSKRFIYYSYSGKSYTRSEYAKDNVSPYGSKWQVRISADGTVTSERLLAANIEPDAVDRAIAKDKKNIYRHI